jgi:Family of unknown function (DUF5691)
MSFLTVLDAAVAGTQSNPAAASETALLGDAAYEGLRRLAGRQLECVGAAPPAVCPVEWLAEIPPAARARLLELLEDRQELLPEWLRLVADRRMRIPFDALPEMLEYARTNAEMQALVAQVGGERLAWLAAHNPEWWFAAAMDAEERFAVGSRDERIVALRQIRARDPGRARTLLQDAWSTERTDTLAALLVAFKVGLSADDEPLLDQALSSARKELRASAIQLLRRLPGSAFARRWTERARSVVRISADSVTIDAPSPPPEDWILDGLDPQGAIVQQVIAFALPSLLQLEPERFERAVRHLLQTNLAIATELLGMLDDAASPEFSTALIQTVFERLGGWGYAAAGLLRELPRRLDSSVASQVRAMLDQFDEPAWAWPYLERLADSLDARAAMRKELEA